MKGILSYDYWIHLLVLIFITLKMYISYIKIAKNLNLVELILTLDNENFKLWFKTQNGSFLDEIIKHKEYFSLWKTENKGVKIFIVVYIQNSWKDDCEEIFVHSCSLKYDSQ